jgi:hypothetical protein
MDGDDVATIVYADRTAAQGKSKQKSHENFIFL